MVFSSAQMRAAQILCTIRPLRAFLILSLSFGSVAFGAEKAKPKATPPPQIFTAEQTSERIQTFLKKAEDLKLWNEREWMLLGYYDRRFLGNLKSRGTESFFLSKEGDTNPRGELEATIYNLFETKERSYFGSSRQEEKQIPRCQYPARYRWLMKRLSIGESDLPKINCEGLNAFRARMGGKAAAVVFSSFYMNNPSSAFGHSLLRVSKVAQDNPNSEKLELLDFGFGYAADQTTPNPLLYAIYGIAGVFRGSYTNIPYYYKVREYNDYESRDLWSYHLNLTDEELTQLVDRIWEVGSTFHYYYYFTLNCSNVLLHAVETAAPRYHIQDELKYYVIPSDTIKAMMKVPGLVSKVTYRPSAFSVFQKRVATMTREEIKSLHVLIDSKFDPKALAAFDTKTNPQSAVAVLDAAADYIDYKYSKYVVLENSDAARWRQGVLVTRAGVFERSKSFTDFIPEEQRPDLGHGSMKVALLGGRESGLNERGRLLTDEYVQFNLRFALHDILDPQVGYPRNSHLEMMAFKLRWLRDAKRLELEDANFFRIMTLSPLTGFNRNLSWRGEMGGKRFRDENCKRCFGTAFEFAGGYSVEPMRGIIFYGMAELGLRHAPSLLGSDIQLGVGPLSGLLIQFGSFGLHANAKYIHQFFSAYPNTRVYSGEFRYNAGQRVALSLEAKQYTKNWDTSASVGVHF